MEQTHCMSKPSKADLRGLQRELQVAQREQRLVRVVRRKSWEQHEGYIVGVSMQWCALQNVDAGLPDGLVLLRVRDVRRLEQPASHPRVARTLAPWPPALPDLIDLHDVRSVLFTAGALAPVLAVSAEKVKPGVFWVGNVHRITHRYAEVQDLKPSGRWRRRGWEHYPLAEITRVHLGTAYLEAVASVAGPRPDIVPRSS